ncbi:MAG: hypothetical protein ACHQYQ_05020 [Bacteriovoracales bacterium]
MSVKKELKKILNKNRPLLKEVEKGLAAAVETIAAEVQEKARKMSGKVEKKMGKMKTKGKAMAKKVKAKGKAIAKKAKGRGKR